MPKIEINQSGNSKNICYRLKERYYTWTSYILFFLPLLFSPHSEFVRTHTKNAILLNAMDLFAVSFLLLGIYFGSKVSYNIMLLFIFITLIGITMLSVSMITKIYLMICSIRGEKITLPIR